MWRTPEERAASAQARLDLARRLWGWQPHPAQGRFFCSAAAVRVAACGRRWGKTDSLSVDLATLALSVPGTRQLVVAPTDAQARLLGEATLARLEEAFARPPDDLAGLELIVKRRPYLQMTVAQMTVAAGEGGPDRAPSPILCRTAGRDGRNLRGLWAHRIVVDEAARVPDGVLLDVLLPMLADKGGEYVLASSPFGRRSAFYRLYARGVGAQAGEAISTASFQCPTTDNAAHLDLAFLAAQREDLGESLYAQEYEAQFVDDFGAVFREEDITAGVATLPGVRLEDGEVHSEVRPDRLYICGIDWGRKRDFSVLVVLDAGERPATLVHLSRWQGTGWDAQAQAAASVICRFRPRRVLADGSSIGDPIAEMLDREIEKQMPPGARRATVERFTFGTESKGRLLDTLGVGLSSRGLKFPPHRALLAELRGFEYAPGDGGRLKMGARSGLHDDCVIALALAYFAAPHGADRPPGARVLLGSQIGAARREG